MHVNKFIIALYYLIVARISLSSRGGVHGFLIVGNQGDVWIEEGL